MGHRDHKHDDGSAVEAAPHAASALQRCLAARYSPRSEPTEAREVPQCDYRAVADLADAHGIGPLLHGCLRGQASRPAIPPEILRRLGGRYIAAAGANTRLYHELAAFADEFAARGAELIALKGAHLAQGVYGDIGLRPMCDLDLLIRRETLPAAEEILARRGYIPYRPEQRQRYEQEHFHIVHRKGRIQIELHWNIIGPEHPLAGELEGLWLRSRPACLAGKAVRVLAPADLILHLCVHAACCHGFMLTLRPLCDIAECIRHFGGEIDWPALDDAARRCGVVRSVNACLLLARKILSAPLPPDVHRRAEAATFAPEAVETITRYVMTTPSAPGVEVPVGLKDAMGAAGGAGRLAALARSIFPRPADMKRIYKLPSGVARLGLFYAWRPVDLLRRKSGDMLRILAGTGAARAAVARQKDKLRIDAWVAQEGEEEALRS
jgi:hypothetical protein